MTTTRTTISGVDGVPSPVAGLDLRARTGVRAREAVVAALALGLMVLVAW